MDNIKTGEDQQLESPKLLNIGSLVNNTCVLNVAKILDNGEDADPLLINENGYLGVFVFDGLGGAGSQKISVKNETKTAAYFASRKVRELTEEFFLNKFKNKCLIDEAVSIEFERFLFSELNKFKDDLKIEKSKIRSSLIKTLPTTISGTIIFNNDVNEIEIISLWAGDSRNYLLTPDSGLKQLTLDDLGSPGDAMKNLTNDSKMSNCINADAEFNINFKSHGIISPPFVLFSSTDGAYDYLPTPMHFEFMLLNAIQKSDSLDKMKKSIILSLEDIVGDDVSMAFVHVGWDDFRLLKLSFEERLTHLNKVFVEPINKAKLSIQVKIEKLESLGNEIDALKQEGKELKEHLWQEYKNTYNDFLKDNLDK